MSYRTWLSAMIILDAEELTARGEAARAHALAGNFLSKRLPDRALALLKRSLRAELGTAREQCRRLYNQLNPRFVLPQWARPANDNDTTEASHARWAGRASVARRTVWTVTIGNMSARCVLVSLEPEDYVVEVRLQSGWSRMSGDRTHGPDPIDLFHRLAHSVGVNRWWP